MVARERFLPFALWAAGRCDISPPPSIFHLLQCSVQGGGVDGCAPTAMYGGCGCGRALGAAVCSFASDCGWSLTPRR